MIGPQVLEASRELWLVANALEAIYAQMKIFPKVAVVWC
jgi:hypothetical protein